MYFYLFPLKFIALTPSFQVDLSASVYLWRYNNAIYKHLYVHSQNAADDCGHWVLGYKKCYVCLISFSDWKGVVFFLHGIFPRQTSETSKGMLFNLMAFETYFSSYIRSYCTCIKCTMIRPSSSYVYWIFIPCVMKKKGFLNIHYWNVSESKYHILLNTSFF